MTLYELTNSMTIQGSFITLSVWDENGNEVDTKDYEAVEDLAYEDIDDYEDMEVTFIYAEGFTRYYPNCSAPCADLKIELRKE